MTSSTIPSPNTSETVQEPVSQQPANSPKIVRKGEYARNGDFHKNLDPNWSYYPIYINKQEVIDELLHDYQAHAGKIVDAGCGEGVVVERYHKQGWDISGFDMNYASELVTEGSLLAIPHADNSVDTLLCLDVMEHLLYPDQNKALAEITRVLKPGGVAIFSVPNLAHFTARLKMLFRGRLLRTASIGHHPGDRPALEYQQLFEAAGFSIEKTLGIFPTIPPIYRFVMKNPGKSVELLRTLRKLPLPPYVHFQVLFACRLNAV